MYLKLINVIILVLLSTKSVLAQKASINTYAAIDKIALSLPDSLTKSTDQIADYISTHFSKDEDKARAIFIWLASNIQYDVENMFALNFYEKKEEKASKCLRTRKGICENYAALFAEISAKSGLKAFVVEGYTKQNGFADYIPHAWNAALVDSSWYLFDPTWGSGYINGGKFVKKINEYYFKASATSFIKSHMPFDYLWQFLNYPITNQAFYEGNMVQNKTKPYFSFKDSILVFEQQSHIEQLSSSAYRVEKNGLKNSLIFDRFQHLKMEIENDKQNTTVSLYNSSVIDYNDALRGLNEFINYRNKQFVPKQADAAIQAMLDEADHKLKDAKMKIKQIANANEQTANLIIQLSKSIDDAAMQMKEQQDWLQLYFSKSKAGRKSMFYKVTWFGIPLN